VQVLETVQRSVLASLVNLNGPGRYVHWGFIQISVANLVLIGLMVVVFIAAILIPFRRHGGNR
jgi:ABC-type proline/glycine betaine transport system permease subunit